MFDHRASIVSYLDERANRIEAAGSRAEATAVRVEASNIAAQLDIETGRNHVATPVDAIIRATCASFGGVSHAEVISHTRTPAAVRVRFACVWVARQRLRWSHPRLAPFFDRDQSTIGLAIDRAKDLRATDDEFRTLTDALLAQPLVCENCQHPLVPAT